MSTQVLQLTDLHLYAKEEQTLKGIPTRATFRDVLEHIRQYFPEFDYIILSGDLADDEQLETYHWLRKTLGSWVSRCVLIPGNHENRACLRTVFPELIGQGGISDNDAITFSFQAGDWRLVGLDSHWPGQVRGAISTEQLDWLKQQLSLHSQQPTIVFLHHPPISVDCEWLDRLGLEEPQDFIDIVVSAPQVRVVCTGHVHHVFQGCIGDAVFLTSPSTSLQFAPQGESVAYDPVPPGFRVFTFQDSDYQTDIVRLSTLKYFPNAET